MTPKPTRARSERRMPLREHFAELRRRLLWAGIGIAVCAVAGWFIFGPAFEALQRPVLEVAQQREVPVTVNFAGLATALDMRIKVSFFLGIILASPWWLYQVWAFIAPGLKRPEKLYGLGFLGVAVPLFGGGVVMGWLLFPRAVEVLTNFTPEGAANILDAQMYLSFAMRVLLAFGIALAFPVVMVAMTWLGVVTYRTWLRGWRWAVMVLLVFAAMATPTPDIVTMLVLAVPMMVLYFSAIGIGALHPRGRGKKAP